MDFLSLRSSDLQKIIVITNTESVKISPFCVVKTNIISHKIMVKKTKNIPDLVITKHVWEKLQV